MGNRGRGEGTIYRRPDGRRRESVSGVSDPSPPTLTVASSVPAQDRGIELGPTKAKRLIHCPPAESGASSAADRRHLVASCWCLRAMPVIAWAARCRVDPWVEAPWPSTWTGLGANENTGRRSIRTRRVLSSPPARSQGLLGHHPAPRRSPRRMHSGHGPSRAAKGNSFDGEELRP